MPTENDLSQLLGEEDELQFKEFNADIAWQIGSALVARARAENLPITIDISRGAHQLFHASRPGTSADNDGWVRRKVNLVQRFAHSSLYMGLLLKNAGKTLQEKFLLPEVEYAAHGGCFPILVRGVGMIGTITVSGLEQRADHQLVIEELRRYLAREHP